VPLFVYAAAAAAASYTLTPKRGRARLVHSRHVDNLAAGILAELDLSRRNY